MRLGKAAQWAEVLANLAVVVSILFLLAEVRRNTAAVDRQARLDQATVTWNPFTENPGLAAILAQIKEVDGAPGDVYQSLMDRYGISFEEAILWHAHVTRTWATRQANFQQSGPTDQLRASIAAILIFPDQQIVWTAMRDQPVFTPEFRAFVDGVEPGG